MGTPLPKEHLLYVNLNKFIRLKPCVSRRNKQPTPVLELLKHWQRASLVNIARVVIEKKTLLFAYRAISNKVKVHVEKDKH